MPRSGDMITEKLVFVVDYVGAENAESGKISLVNNDSNNELDSIINPKAVNIGADTTELTATAVNSSTASVGPFVFDITIAESNPAINTTYKEYEVSKYAVKLSVEGGRLPDGSYAELGGKKYFSSNGDINISPLNVGNYKVNVYSPVPLSNSNVTFNAILLDAASNSPKIPTAINKTVTFNCTGVAIDADVTYKVFNPGTVSQIDVTLKHEGIDEVRLNVNRKNIDGTYSELLGNVEVTLSTNGITTVSLGNGFTAVSDGTYIFSFVGYSGDIAVIEDKCCVVGGYLSENN